MIKTAASTTESKVIAVCATPATLASNRYETLIAKHAAHLTILEPDCSTWAYMIENNRINRQKIVDVINTVCDEGADVIVLGCTHYHWIKSMIAEIAGDRAVILEPSEAISQRVASLITPQVR
jgi:glutamate racemase